MPRRPLTMTDEAKADAVARAVIVDIALPRLLQTARDPDSTATALLADLQRRLAMLAARGEIGSAGVANLAQAAAQRILAEAIRVERSRRAAELGTDGTP